MSEWLNQNKYLYVTIKVVHTLGLYLVYNVISDFIRTHQDIQWSPYAGFLITDQGSVFLHHLDKRVWWWYQSMAHLYLSILCVMWNYNKYEISFLWLLSNICKTVFVRFRREIFFTLWQPLPIEAQCRGTKDEFLWPADSMQNAGT